MARRRSRSSELEADDREVTGIRSRADVENERGAVLLRRAHRLADDGEYRKAALALRERCAVVGDAASWVLAGAMWARAGRIDDAVASLREGMWMHQRSGHPLRARSVANFIARIDPTATGLDRARRLSA